MKIFVAAGTHPQPFNRLLEELDRIAERENGRHTIFAQIGCPTYLPKHFEFVQYLQGDEYEKKVESCDLAIVHGGAGSIIDALRQHKKVIVVPRQKELGEHTNDHQIDLAKALEEEGKVLAVYNIKDLEQKIKQAESFTGELTSSREGMIQEIQEFLNKIQQGKN